jgi:hypothetical protein
VIVLYLLTGSFVLWAIGAEGMRDAVDPDLESSLTVWFGYHGLFIFGTWHTYWQAAFVTGLLTIAGAVVWQRLDSLPFRRARDGRCTACGYDLFANISRRCPECGQAVLPYQHDALAWRMILRIAVLHSILSVATAYVAVKTDFTNENVRVMWESAARILLSPLIWFGSSVNEFWVVFCNSLIWATALGYCARNSRTVRRHPALALAAVLLLVFFDPYVERRYQRVDLKALGFFNFDQRFGTIEDVPAQVRLLDGQRVQVEGFMWDPTLSIRTRRFQLVYDFKEHRPPLVQDRIFAITPWSDPARCIPDLIRISGVLHVQVKRNYLGMSRRFLK